MKSNEGMFIPYESISFRQFQSLAVKQVLIETHTHTHTPHTYRMCSSAFFNYTNVVQTICIIQICWYTSVVCINNFVVLLHIHFFTHSLFVHIICVRSEWMRFAETERSERERERYVNRTLIAKGFFNAIKMALQMYGIDTQLSDVNGFGRCQIYRQMNAHRIIFTNCWMVVVWQLAQQIMYRVFCTKKTDFKRMLTKHNYSFGGKKKVNVVKSREHLTNVWKWARAYTNTQPKTIRIIDKKKSLVRSVLCRA